VLICSQLVRSRPLKPSLFAFECSVVEFFAQIDRGGHWYCSPCFAVTNRYRTRIVYGCTMKLVAAAALVLALASSAHAAPILSVNFCPGNLSCPGGLLEASLSFTEDTSTTDVNDYFLDILFRGDSSAPVFLDELSFTISGFPTPTGYESAPTLQSASGGTNWQVFYDNISASAASCTSNTNNGNEVCLQSGPGDAQNLGAQIQSQSLLFQLLVDLSGTNQLTATTPVNLRAQFLQDNAILSPDFAGTNTTPPPVTTAVPEPTTLLMLGVGLLGIGRQYRRRRRRAD